MFQNMIADHVSRLDKVLDESYSIRSEQVTVLVNDGVGSLEFSDAQGSTYSIILDVPSDVPEVLCSCEIGLWISAADLTTLQLTFWAKTQRTASFVPTFVASSDNSDYLTIDRVHYVDATKVYVVLKARFLVPNLVNDLTLNEQQFISVAFAGPAGSAYSGYATYKLRAYTKEVPFFQPMK